MEERVKNRGIIITVSCSKGSKGPNVPKTLKMQNSLMGVGKTCNGGAIFSGGLCGVKTEVGNWKMGF